MASITNVHVQEKPPVKFDNVQGSDSEKSSPQSQNRVPIQVEVTHPEVEVLLFHLVLISII